MSVFGICKVLGVVRIMLLGWVVLSICISVLNKGMFIFCVSVVVVGEGLVNVIRVLFVCV